MLLGEERKKNLDVYTVCPRSPDPFYTVNYYINWVKTSWPYSTSLKEGFFYPGLFIRLTFGVCFQEISIIVYILLSFSSFSA